MDINGQFSIAMLDYQRVHRFLNHLGVFGCLPRWQFLLILLFDRSTLAMSKNFSRTPPYQTPASYFKPEFVSKLSLLKENCFKKCSWLGKPFFSEKKKRHFIGHHSSTPIWARFPNFPSIFPAFLVLPDLTRHFGQPLSVQVAQDLVADGRHLAPWTLRKMQMTVSGVWICIYICM